MALPLHVGRYRVKAPVLNLLEDWNGTGVVDLPAKDYRIYKEVKEIEILTRMSRTMGKLAETSKHVDEHCRDIKKLRGPVKELTRSLGTIKSYVEEVVEQNNTLIKENERMQRNNNQLERRLDLLTHQVEKLVKKRGPKLKRIRVKQPFTPIKRTTGETKIFRLVSKEDDESSASEVEDLSITELGNKDEE